MRKHFIVATTVKGGTGKSTTATVLAQAAALDGRRTLCIDLDPQGNASFWLNAEPGRPTAAGLFSGTPAAEAIQHTASGVDLIPSSGSLINVATYNGSAKRLAEALEPIRRRYDFVTVDTPPFMGELQNNALMAMNEAIIPIEADLFSIHGLQATVGIIDAAKKNKRNLAYLGVLVTMYETRRTARAEFKNMIQDYADAHGVPYLGEIRRSVRLPECAAMGQVLFDYAPSCGPAIDYMELYKRITATD